MLEKERLKQTISNLMSGLDDPSDLNKSQIEESAFDQEVEKLAVERQLNQEVSQIIVPKPLAEEEEVEVIEDKKEEEEDNLKKSAGFGQDQEKIHYINHVDKVEKLDAQTRDNLMYLMEAGFTNFDVNYGLLKRHNNDLAVVMNMICNGLVSDSIFL